MSGESVIVISKQGVQDQRLKGNLATCDINSTTELFVMADKAAKQAEACEDPVDKCRSEKALRATSLPSLSKRDYQRKIWQSGSEEVLASGQDDCR
ncbi:hypothetical protein E2562_018754 [Oryza meyeriana var. granulata]|uniref:Uncharacterized protein n=1 Tax=Oryza meyeriana var. granulata TaxID=110450 RepID=A0A6G1EMY6_9ORYZ|nr:hypothetical protein E2562_018754 [Oryza meyeriana var. granulata]